MADDFGDDAGDKLLEWSIRIMIEHGRGRAREASSKLAGALRSAQKQIERGAPEKEAPDAAARGEWAKLDLCEFEGIDGWDELEGVIGADLAGRGIAHEWFDDEAAGKRYLLFRTGDARELATAFGNLADRAEQAHEQAAAAIERMREAERGGREAGERAADAGDPRRDRPLKERAETARRLAGDAARADRTPPEKHLAEQRERGRG